MLSQMKTNSTRKLEGKRPKELMSSSSLSGMSQLSNSSEETLEPLVHKPHKLETTESTTKDASPQNNEWLLSGPSGNKSILRFKCSALATPPKEPPAKILHMTYKIFQTDTKLINLLLQSHGLTEVPMNEMDFNILWMGNHPKPDILRNLMPYQKVNHFPRSYEITRKDRLYKNIEAMQRSKGLRNLDFIPQTFLLPTESRELLTAHFRYRGPWIVKPKASSRGRGIYIVNSVSIIISSLKRSLRMNL